MKFILESFYSTDNLRMSALHNDVSHDTCAIYLHGGYSSVFYSQSRIHALANSLNKIGISFFAFNNRGANLFNDLKNIEENRVRKGSAFEILNECEADIDGALAFLRKKYNYKKFALIGHSTGANKIAVYNFLKKANIEIDAYVLLSASDDNGLYRKILGETKYKNLLEISKLKIKEGKGGELDTMNFVDYYSYNSIYDNLDPDGYYNTFPFNEYSIEKRIGTKDLFVEIKSIILPTLYIYGEKDEYLSMDAKKAISILEKVLPSNNHFAIISNADHGFRDKEIHMSDEVTKFLSTILNQSHKQLKL